MKSFTARQALLTVYAMLLFSSFNEGIVSIFSYSDEVLLAISTIILTLRPNLKIATTRVSLTILIYLTYSIVNSLLSPFNPNLLFSIAQSLIHIKIFIISLAAIKIYKGTSSDIKLISFLFHTFISLYALGFLANIALGESWNLLFSSEPIQYRYGFIRPTGYFGHYAPNSYFLSISLITIMMLRAKTPIINRASQVRKFFLFILIDFATAFPLTVRKGLFVIAPYSLYVISLLKPSNRIYFTVAAVIFLTISIFLISGTEIYSDTVTNIGYFFSDDHAYIRGLIVYNGFKLFLEFFPLGVGNGLYGTVFSNMNLSVYDHVGLNLNAFTRADGSLSGVYDSGIFSLLAENGFIGTFIAGVFIWNFFSYNKEKLDPHNYKIFKIISYFAILLSLTEPVWQNGLFSTFFTISILYIYTKNNKYIIEKNGLPDIQEHDF